MCCGRHHPRNAELLLLDRNTAFSEVDLDTGGLLPLLIELVAEYPGGDGENADDDLENVTVHGLVAPLGPGNASSDQPTLSSGRVPAPHVASSRSNRRNDSIGRASS
jgi:hypothetical protein